ncbi:hypothetical protein OL229_15770 [Neisseriaceae bacterium JH1-16]|nr:hypothetical protein [Neisseriaceae bacterium JH1-16]
MKHLTLAVVTAALGAAAASGYAADSQPASHPTIVVAKSAEVKAPAKPVPSTPLKPHRYKPIHHAHLGSKKPVEREDQDTKRLKPSTTAQSATAPIPAAAATASVAK